MKNKTFTKDELIKFAFDFYYDMSLKMNVPFNLISENRDNAVEYYNQKHTTVNVHELVYGFKTKNKEGFVQSEIDTLLKNFPEINMEKFDGALMGITCMMIDNELVIYHCDIESALNCGIENRNLKTSEWD